MATLLPPPKRQKVYHGIPEPEPEPKRQSPHIVVQFVSEDDGQPLAPAVNLPANLSREGLEALVNKLNVKACDSSFSFVPFFITLCSSRTRIPFHFLSMSPYLPK